MKILKNKQRGLNQRVCRLWFRQGYVAKLQVVSHYYES